ncbi:MAG: M14 family zinc carboxypeptidase, partial [bacterium]
MKKNYVILFVCFFSILNWCFANDFDFYPGATYKSEIPTLKQVVGHSWGEKITSPAQLQRYLKTLAEASPEVQLVEYGQTWEGRTLYYLIVTSKENMSRIEEIKSG